MRGTHPTVSVKGPWRVLLALLCVSLVVFAGSLQVIHSHNGPDTHADCSLCAAAHVTIQLAQTPAPAQPVKVVVVLEDLPLSVANSALSTFALFTRPPPAV